MSVKLYEINGEWLTWDHLHNVLGYTMTQSIAVSYKSALHDTWGENAGNGYALNSDGELSQWSMWSEGFAGWFDANGLAEQGAYPASSADLFLERTGEEAKAVSLDDGVNTYYLIDGYLDLGWRLWEVLEAEGWQISSGGKLAYIVVDATTGEIVHSIVDEGMVYGEVGYVLMDSSNDMILVPTATLPLVTFYLNPEGRDATENHTLTFTENPVFDEVGDSILYADYTDLQGDRPFCFMRVDNTFFLGGSGDSLINLSEGKAGIGALASRGKSAWSVSFEREPAPTAYFTNQGASGTSNYPIGNGSNGVLLYDENGALIDVSAYMAAHGLSNYDQFPWTITGYYDANGNSVTVSYPFKLSADSGKLILYPFGTCLDTYQVFKLTYTET